MALRVMLCCNDWRNGNFTGFADSVEIEDVRLVGGRVAVRYDHGKRVPGAHSIEGDDTLRFGRIRVPALAYVTWVGNWCWDCASVRSIHALTLLNYLAVKLDWHTEDTAEEIAEAFDKRKVITPSEWKRYRANEAPSEPTTALDEAQIATEARIQPKGGL